MYCPECGTRLEDDALFCPECGTKVMHEEEAAPVQQQPQSQPQQQSQPAQPQQQQQRPQQQQTSRPAPQQQQQPAQPMEQPDTRPVFARGLILTNIATLSHRLKIDELALKGIIENYIEKLKNLGLSYRLIDASDYTYMQSNIFGKHKHVSLSGRDPWYAYAELAMDQHEWERKKSMPESEYLFIIGGNHDVPMPRVRNFIASRMDGLDKTMDTDILYAYPYGQQMEQDLLSQRIFRYDALFYVGRLPIADNASLDDLVGYLDRNIKLDCTVPLGAAYCQSDPNWKRITNAITDPLYEFGLFPEYEKAPEEVIFNGHIILSPNIIIDKSNDLHESFNPDAGYIFFNLHGGDDMRSYYYYGKTLDQRHCYPAFSPRLVSRSRHPNILFTQACFGGRIVDYPKEYSMAMTALSSMTMAFVGSSRTALGGYDAIAQLSCSDILAESFNRHVLMGESVGASFFAARIDTFKYCPGDLDHALTIAEFNLYGDPMVHLGVPESRFTTAHVSKSAPLSQDEVLNVPQEEIVMNKSANAGSQSLLTQLRQAVDSNIMKIHEVISKQLYEQFNMPAREPLIITRKTYPDGHKELGYDYPLDTTPEIGTSKAFVTTSEQGDIKKIILTK